MDILDQLLSSRVRAKILESMFLSSGLMINAYALTRTIGENYNAVWKELVRLESLGILKSVKRGKTKDYSVNPACPIEQELRSIVLKTKGIGSILREELGDKTAILAAFIFGSYAAGTADERSDIDLFLIGDPETISLSKMIYKVEEKIHRPINHIVMTPAEWNNKKKLNEPFIQNVINLPKIFIIGDNNAL